MYWCHFHNSEGDIEVLWENVLVCKKDKCIWSHGTLINKLLANCLVKNNLHYFCNISVSLRLFQNKDCSKCLYFSEVETG